MRVKLGRIWYKPSKGRPIGISLNRSDVNRIIRQKYLNTFENLDPNDKILLVFPEDTFDNPEDRIEWLEGQEEAFKYKEPKVTRREQNFCILGMVLGSLGFWIPFLLLGLPMIQACQSLLP